MALLIITLAGIAWVLYHRKQRRIMIQIRNVVEKTGISKEEASILTNAREGLFIESKFVEIDFGEILGKGSTATVYHGKIKGPAPIQRSVKDFEIRKFENCNAAIKIGDDFRKDTVEKFLNEIDAARKIKFHKNICLLLGWTFHQGLPSTIFEHVDTNLLSWIRDNKDFELKEIYKIFFQITSAMIRISSLGLIHRDLASRNILLNNFLEVKLTDFGLCCSSNRNSIFKDNLQNKLPVRWLSLEALMKKIFSEFSDVWSFGVLSYEVFSFGDIPYSNVKNTDLIEYLESGKRLQKLENIPENFWTIMESCWNQEIDQRPNFIQLNKSIRMLIEELEDNYDYIYYDEKIE